jgi:hypothetical protein
MILGFLAIIGKRKVAASFRHGHGGTGCQNDTLVRRSEQHIELDITRHYGFGIEARQVQGGQAVVKQTGIEEVRRFAPCLGDELAKFQTLLVECKTDKILAEIAHIIPLRN